MSHKMHDRTSTEYNIDFDHSMRRSHFAKFEEFFKNKMTSVCDFEKEWGEVRAKFHIELIGAFKDIKKGEFMYHLDDLDRSLNIRITDIGTALNYTYLVASSSLIQYMMLVTVGDNLPMLYPNFACIQGVGFSIIVKNEKVAEFSKFMVEILNELIAYISKETQEVAEEVAQEVAQEVVEGIVESIAH